MDQYSGSAHWSSSSTAVATVTAYTGLVTAVGAGSATITASIYAVDGSINRCADNFVHCPSKAFIGFLTANVVPTLGSISPSQGPVGMTVGVTINGSGFGTSPTVNAGTGITVTINSTSNTQIQASFNISASAPAGNHSVTVTAAGQTSNSLNFFVQVPTSLSIVAGTDSTTTEAPCTTSAGLAGCKVTRTFMYQVKDQNNQPITVVNMPFGDVICNTSTNQLNLQGYNTTCGGMTGTCFGTAGPCGQFTDSNGQFTENLKVCAPACKSSGICTTAGQTIANVTWTVAGHAITSDVKSTSYQCNKILVNGQ